ncbi:homoserine O-acetyltransferase family protein [Actinotignum timonense]|uniref:Homoserine O-acetyltransferase n=1 Tax=Actinotignum timonense TaxID=1870995 RepID=A0ABU5GAL9_9ACTO|nr:homoserine O-acetyltransferase [Actinotignum timonense]MDY5145764.1 homoserine O-acetyltransferase [Actinotignum timonense]
MTPSPQFLVGHAPLDPVTDAEPIGDFDTGYTPAPRLTERPTGAWLEGDDPGERRFADLGPLELELGGRLPQVRLAYETWGQLNADRSNAVLLCHALTGDSHAAARDGQSGWWKDIVGPGLAIDTDRYYVVCPNVLGGCQGSTGPASPAPDGQPWGPRFPEITMRDMAAAEARLADLLGVERWALVAGASFGGCRTMEWAASFPERVGAFAVLVAGPASTAEHIAYAHLQNLAIRLDPRWRGGHYYDAEPDESGVSGPDAGLGLAREIAHLTYRCAPELAARFGRARSRPCIPRTATMVSLSKIMRFPRLLRISSPRLRPRKSRRLQPPGRALPFSHRAARHSARYSPNCDQSSPSTVPRASIITCPALPPACNHPV